jgi:uncharacterized repeat protein (TIGR01451 family)
MSKRFLVAVLLAGTGICLFCLALITGPSRSEAQKPPVLTQTLSIDVEGMGITVSYPEGWSVSPKQFINMKELINVAADQQNTLQATASIKIRSQTRTDHAEALHELKEIAAEVDSPSTFLNIGHWPALQRRHMERRQQPSEGPRFADEMALRITTAVAAGNLLVRLDGLLPSDADQKLINVVEAVGRSLVFTVSGNPAQVREELENLRNSARQKSSLSVPPLPATDEFSKRSVPSESRGFSEEFVTEPGATQRLFTGGNGELEIAVSPNGQNVVIARQNNFKASNDGGQTFPFSGSLNLGDGDPSVAFGQSGNFYLAGIRRNCQPADAAGPFGYTCTGILRSTNNGQSFALLSNAVVCPNADPSNITPVPGSCFPDQEHIAADRVNAASGGDQVYSTWRNFDATDQDPAIVCSQNSGATWTAPIDVDSGFIPRIGVGQDGFVYVVYRSGNNIRINKYSSCANGLATQPTFPKTISTVTDVACPVPGLDRCNNGNNLSSIMVAVDDTNPNHVYVAYADQTAAGNQNILVRDSLDGGVTWPAARVATVNSAVLGVRFMPWVCTTGGKAFVTWYDRRASTPCPSPPCAANNDLTDYFAGSAGLDGMGNLVAGAEFKLTDAADPQCAGGATPGSAASWPCGVRAMADSESCSVQPQLAGRCQITTSPPCPPNGAPCGTFTPCDFDQGPACPTFMGNAQICGTGGGCPKYGDYNGNACVAGRLFAAWAAGTPPSGITPSGGIDIFFAVAPPFSSDLSITKTDSPDPVTTGNNLTYAVTVTNNGPDTAISVTVTDNLPAETTFVSCSSTGGGVCGGSANNRTVTFPSLASGESETITFVATVNCSVADGTVISDTATVSSVTPDPNPSNNSATVTTTASNPPPTITGVAADPSVLWPPNHKLVNVTVNYNVTDNCPLPPGSCTLSVTSNEPINGTGDGHTSPDWIVLDDHHVLLRAERAGNGNGRIYTITITCTDSGGNSSSEDVMVTVPHDRRR